MFAQNFNNNRNDDGAMALIVISSCAFLAVFLAIQIFFLLNLSKCLQEVRPRNRDMEPGQVWLSLIPLFSIIWMFIVVTRVSSSLKHEYRDRRWNSRGEDFGQSIGIAYCACTVVSCIPYLGAIVGIGGLVCFIMYWVKISSYRNELASESNSGYDDDEDDDDDDYDERPKPKLKPRRNRDDARDGNDPDERDRNRNRSDDEYDR